MDSFFLTVAATPSEIIRDKYSAYYSLEDVIDLKRSVDHKKTMMAELIHISP